MMACRWETEVVSDYPFAVVIVYIWYRTAPLVNEAQVERVT